MMGTSPAPLDPRYEAVLVRPTAVGDRFIAAMGGSRRRSGAGDTAEQSLLALARTYCLTGDERPGWLPDGAAFCVLVHVEGARDVVGSGATFPDALIAATDHLLD